MTRHVISSPSSSTATSLVEHNYWLPSRFELRNSTDCSEFLTVTLRLADYRQTVRLGDKALETHDHNNFVCQLTTCGYRPYVTSSLTKGWVCRLQLLMVLASAVIPLSEPRGSRHHILLSQIWDTLNLDGQVPVFIFPKNRVARLYPQAMGYLFIAS
jgi:predicted solute-binding protein